MGFYSGLKGLICTFYQIFLGYKTKVEMIGGNTQQEQRWSEMYTKFWSGNLNGGDGCITIIRIPKK